MKLSHESTNPASLSASVSVSVSSHPSAAFNNNEPNPVDKLLAKLSEQQAVLNKQHEALRLSDEYGNGSCRSVDYSSGPSSVPITPATETFNTGTASTAPTTRPQSRNEEGEQLGAEEVLRLKLELEAAKGR